MNEDKKVLVTGASGGIGRAIAVDAAKAGYYVICHYCGSQAKAEETLNQIKAAGGQGELIQFDVSNRDDCKAKLDELTAKHGVLWGIVNNAGITRDNTFAALSGEDWDKVIHTNLDSFYNVLNPLIMPMASRKNKRGGRIITISSVSGVNGNRGQTNYSAAKAGIIGATKALAVELAGRGITVNAVAPGVIETEMTKAIDPAVYDIIMSTIPMKRAGQPEEIASAVTYLLSEGAAYITRQVIEIDGGM
ncbi:MAG: 3-oxoacyl-ACP reductase FabG [Treponema sp.]|nr:3-oxoacyl-ACP reductase FabG [Spirochaetales bacterium]MDY6190411.1 3-oxoacyl-ACP reductase FabG [Treponema sp.]